MYLFIGDKETEYLLSLLYPLEDGYGQDKGYYNELAKNHGSRHAKSMYEHCCSKYSLIKGLIDKLEKEINNVKEI